LPVRSKIDCCSTQFFTCSESGSVFYNTTYYCTTISSSCSSCFQINSTYSSCCSSCCLKNVDACTTSSSSLDLTVSWRKYFIYCTQNSCFMFHRMITNRNISNIRNCRFASMLRLFNNVLLR
jgi:hypothetical protein